MRLNDLTEHFVKQFAGSTIFNRGNNYYRNGMVYDLRYDAGNDSIQAQVSGNYGDYEVDITMQDNHISADCDCPYDGYPCKHIVAVLLTFLHQKSQYQQQAQKQKQAESSLMKKVKSLSEEELVELLLSYSKKYPDVKRDLMVRLESNKKATFTSIKRQIAGAFPSVESRNYAPRTIAKQLRTILKSVENASKEMQLKVYWVVTDRTLKELNDYGMDEETLENVAINTMEDLVNVAKENGVLQEEKAAIIEQLMDYYIWGNCGLVDFIYATVTELCSSKSDYKLVIEKLKRKLAGASFKSYYQDLLADLYEQIGDTESQRATLEGHLEYGGDYWRLAEYWLNQGEQEKALTIIHEGLEKGQGRKTELYEALQKHYQQRKEYDKIFELLERKVARQDLDHRSFKLDSTYQLLRNYYKKQKNYEGRGILLEMRLLSNAIDLEFYQEAEKTLTAEDWQTFELRILKNLHDRLRQQKKQRTGFGWMYAPYTSSEATVLAEIYHYKQDVDNLFDTVKDNIELLRKYEALLMPHYTVEYLEQYRNRIDRLIADRGRQNYQAAVPYAKAIKKMYTDILHTPDEWTAFITNLRQKNKTLRALQQEFARL